MKAASRGVLLVLLALAGAGCAHTTQAIDDSDPAIKARVEAALSGKKDVDIRFVTVDVVQGLVTISGLVTSLEQRRAIDRIIRRIHGVDGVNNNLAIQE